MDEAQGMAMPCFESAATVARRPGRHLVEQFALHGRAACQARRRLWHTTLPGIDIPHNVEYIVAAQSVRFRRRNLRSGVRGRGPAGPRNPFERRRGPESRP